MADFPMFGAQDAPADARPMLEAAQKNYGFTPNLLKIMAGAPAILEAYMATAGAMDKTSLSPVEQQVVLLAASYVNECGYCMAAHSTVAGMVGMPADALNAIRSGAPISDARLEALREFTQKVVTARGWVTQSEVDAFVAAGFSASQALEVILGVAMKTMSNYVNHLVNTPVDEAFQPQAWQARQAAE